MRTVWPAGLVLALTAAATPGLVAQSNVAGLEVRQFHSQVYDAPRTFRVLLPDGYSAPEHATRTYPVLYLFDGQNLFDSSTSLSASSEWRADETVKQLTGSGVMPPLIIVGIDSGGRRERAREYLPWADEFLRPPEPNPNGGRLPEFVDEVKSWVDRLFRTDRQPRMTGIGGSSYGALAATYVAAVRSGAFGRLLLESPSFYVHDGEIFRAAAGVRRWPERIYLGGGTNEGGRRDCDPASDTMPELVADVRRFERMLIDAGVPRESILVNIVPCALHNEDAWARRLPTALRFLYGR